MLLALACRGPGGPSEAELYAPSVEHGPAPAYAGTWVGPELSLHFAGPWVLVWPSNDPGAAPIEMRVLVERSEGSAYALRTTLGGVFEADFLRPSDWTLLVEQGQLAIAMGDEPLTAYLADPSVPAPLLGPSMVDPDRLPEHLLRDDALACLEHAADACAALEAQGPPALGCRELHWGACLAEREPAPLDPTVRATQALERELSLCTRTLEFGLSLRRANERPAAGELYERVLAAARALLARLAAEDMLGEQAQRATIERALAAASARAE